VNSDRDRSHNDYSDPNPEENVSVEPGFSSPEWQVECRTLGEAEVDFG
jgi:hypothetical protein